MLQACVVFLCFSSHSAFLTLPAGGLEGFLDDPTHLQKANLWKAPAANWKTAALPASLLKFQQDADAIPALSLDDAEYDTSYDEKDKTVGQVAKPRSLRQDAPTRAPVWKTRMAGFLQAVVSGIAAIAPEDSKQFAQTGADGLAFLIGWFESGQTWSTYQLVARATYLNSLSDDDRKVEEARFQNGKREAVLNIIGFALLLIMAGCDLATKAGDGVAAAAGADPGTAILASLKDVFIVIRVSFAMVLEVIKVAVSSKDPNDSIWDALRAKFTLKFFGYVCWMLFKGIARFLLYAAVAAAITAVCLGATWGGGTFLCGMLGSVVGSVASWALNWVFKGMEFACSSPATVRDYAVAFGKGVGNFGYMGLVATYDCSAWAISGVGSGLCTVGGLCMDCLEFAAKHYPKYGTPGWPGFLPFRR